MLEQIFAFLISGSICGTLLAAVLILIRPLTRKIFSASWHYYVWVCVLALILIPIKITLYDKPISAIHIREETQAEEKTLAIVTDNGEYIPVSADNTKEIALQKKYEAQELFKESLPYIMGVYFAVAVILLLTKLVSYGRFINVMKKQSELIYLPQISEYTGRNITVRVCGGIHSPLIIGVLKPVLLLPKAEMTDEQISNILLHETTHLKRNDVLIKWGAMLVKCVHWFNPAVYLICKNVNSECETSCDEAVVKNMTKQEKISYIDTILSLVSGEKRKAVALTTGMTGSKKSLKRRFTMINNKKRISKTAVVLSVVLAVALVVGALLISGYINGKVSSEIGNLLVKDGAEYVGYIENAETDFIKVYTEIDGEYVMSIPWAVIEYFPANDRNSEGYEFGWIEHVSFYCGQIEDFVWVVASSKPAFGASNVNICTSADGGKNWYVDNMQLLRFGIVDGAKFVSEEEGYISLFDIGGNGPGFAQTIDGGKSWECIIIGDMSNILTKEQAIKILKEQLIEAYQNTYGEYVPRADDPGNMSGDKARLPYIIEHLEIKAENDYYYTVPVIWDFRINKYTGDIYKYYNGLANMMIHFDPSSPNALGFAG